MKCSIFALCLALASLPAQAAVFGSIRGVVHDPDHRPVSGAKVVVSSATSAYSQALTTAGDGSFQTVNVPVGTYEVTASHDGLEPARQGVTVESGNAPVLHFQLAVAGLAQAVTVEENVVAVSADSMTPTVLVSRKQIAETPGASLTNSMNMITDYVPGAWMTHDQLHVRGGHQVTWAIDGVPIPNTNIASDVGPQIDPKDIDYLEAERGGFSAAYGDRTYGVFNVVPRTGFERNREAELTTTLGSFWQTNDQLNFGDHTEKLAYFASVNGNRSDFGLETPGPEVSHDRAWGLGGMATLIYNKDADNQFRFVTTMRRDTYQVPGSLDLEQERDAVADMSWAHILSPGKILTISPFYHYNRANYDGDPDAPITTVQHRSSQYAGAQVAFSAVTARNSLQAGFYGFGQHDDELIDLSGNGDSVSQRNVATGQIESFFVEEQFKLWSWLTLIGGARLTHFAGSLSENAADPRLGGTIRIPGLHWVLRGFWGCYYQAPPLSTVSGPLLQFALSQGLGFEPLRGERDEEHQFGLTIPARGWSIDVNDYHQRAHNYFDHNSIGSSNIFFPLTIDHARLYGWEVAIRSPRLWGHGDVTLAYAYAHAEGAGAISGGLTDFSPPDAGYFLLDHDQRHTLHAGYSWRLPHRVTAGGNLYYGSGFTDGTLDYAGHLQAHTTFDASFAKDIGERVSVSVTALNAANRRFLLDDSATFGGTHYADPRQIYLQLRYRFGY